MELTYSTDASHKFWHATLTMEHLEIHFGRIGTKGQSSHKVFPSAAQAQGAYDTLVCQKLAKGYKPTPAMRRTFVQSLPADTDHAALASLYIGEYYTPVLCDDLCAWMTACLVHAMTPRQFSHTWGRLVDQEDEALQEALGRTHEDPDDDESDMYWIDTIEEGEGLLSDLYATAYKAGGTHFLWYNQNCYVDIVAMRGDPGAAAIERVVLGEHAVDQYPTLRPGTPIASMLVGAFDVEVLLRDGTALCVPFDPEASAAREEA